MRTIANPRVKFNPISGFGFKLNILKLDNRIVFESQFMVDHKPKPIYFICQFIDTVHKSFIFTSLFFFHIPMKKLSETNPYLTELDTDTLYHLGFTSKEDLKKLFGDVRYVVMHGANHRAKDFAEMVRENAATNKDFSLQMGVALGADVDESTLKPLGSTDRFFLFKIGDIISISHGMGQPSHSILLHEITKLLSHSGVKNVEYFRLGTSGGIGVEPGTIVLTQNGVDPSGQAQYKLHRLGELVEIAPTNFDPRLIHEILDVRDDINVVLGDTSSNNDFHYEQARMDGAFCDFTRDEQQAYLRSMHQKGVRNFEMESAGFAAFCNRLGIPAACMCVALLNRFEGDQVSLDPDTYADYCSRPWKLMMNYLKMAHAQPAVRDDIR